MKIELLNPKNEVLAVYDLPRIPPCAECDGDAPTLHSRYEKLGEFKDGEDDEVQDSTRALLTSL